MNREDFDNLVAGTFSIKLPVCDRCEEVIEDGEVFWGEGYADDSNADEINEYPCLCDSCYSYVMDSFVCPNCDEMLDADGDCEVCDGGDE